MPANNLSLVFVKVGRPSQPHISPARSSSALRPVESSLDRSGLPRPPSTTEIPRLVGSMESQIHLGSRRFSPSLERIELGLRLPGQTRANQPVGRC